MEYFDPNDPAAEWIHVSYNENGANRKQVLTFDGKKYTESLPEMKWKDGEMSKIKLNFFNKIDTVNGHCEECGEKLSWLQLLRLLQMHKLWSRHQATYQWLY